MNRHALPRRHARVRRAAVRSCLEALESRRLLTTGVWDGGGQDNLWSTPANWMGNVAPVAGDNLDFPANASEFNATNDYPAATSFGSIDVVSGQSAYVLSGNSVTLGSFIGSDGSLSNEIAFPVIVGADNATFGAQENAGTLVISGAIDLNGHNVNVGNGGGKVRIDGVISGEGNINAISGASQTMTLTAANTYEGNMFVSDGTVYINNTSGSATGTGIGGIGIYQGAVLRGSGSFHGEAFILGAILPGATVGSTGILHTGLLEFYTYDDTVSYNVNINGTTVGDDYDQIAATGEVVIGTGDSDPRPILGVEFGQNFVPEVGDTFTIISNDGQDSITGNFRGLLEGDSMFLGASSNEVYRISYAGGDGNDVTLTYTGTVAKWDGGGSDNKWSTPENWVNDVIPEAGQHLIFPNGSLQADSENDFPAGTEFASLRIEGSAQTLSGNRITLTDGIYNAAASGATNVDLAITLGADAAFTLATDAQLIVNGNINTNGHKLTLGGYGTEGNMNLNGVISGSGSVHVANTTIHYVTVSLDGDNTYTGGTFVDHGHLFINGEQAGSVTSAIDATLHNSSLNGNGTTGAITIGEGAYVQPSAFGSAYQTLTANGDASFAAEALGLYSRIGTSNGQSDRLAVNGDVSLGGGAALRRKFRHQSDAGLELQDRRQRRRGRNRRAFHLQRPRPRLCRIAPERPNRNDRRPRAGRHRPHRSIHANQLRQR